MFNLTRRDQNQNYPVRSLQRSIDDLFNDFFNDSMLSSSNNGSNLVKTFQPRANISEDEKAYYIDAELAGMKKEDVKLRCDENNTLSISAEKKEEHRDDKKNYHRIERFSGSFFRSFHLPENVDRDNIKAEMKDGVLQVTLPKKEKAASKASEIKIS